MKILKVSIIVLLLISILVNIRLFILWSASNELFQNSMTQRYFSDQIVLEKLRNEDYQEAINELNKYSEKYGATVAIICIEKSCETVK